MEVATALLFRGGKNRPLKSLEGGRKDIGQRDPLSIDHPVTTEPGAEAGHWWKNVSLRKRRMKKTGRIK